MESDKNSVTYKATADTIENSELARKYTSTPEQHLRHLLNIGYAPDSPLIQKYLRMRNLCLPTEPQNQNRNE